MPLYSLDRIDKNTILAIWKITESRDELLQMLENAVSDPDSGNKAGKYWPASRLLIKIIFPDADIFLFKDANNKPDLVVDGSAYHISITHSHEMAAVLISSVNNVAVDLERVDDRVNRVSHKFVNDFEWQILSDSLSTMHLTLIWSAKESLYKIYSKRGLDFRKNMFIQSFQGLPDQINGSILKDDEKYDFGIAVKFIEDYVLTYISA